MVNSLVGAIKVGFSNYRALAAFSVSYRSLVPRVSPVSDVNDVLKPPVLNNVNI